MADSRPELSNLKWTHPHMRWMLYLRGRKVRPQLRTRHGDLVLEPFPKALQNASFPWTMCRHSWQWLSSGSYRCNHPEWLPTLDSYNNILPENLGPKALLSHRSKTTRNHAAYPNGHWTRIFPEVLLNGRISRRMGKLGKCKPNVQEIGDAEQLLICSP